MLKPKLRRLLDRLFIVPALLLVIGPVQTAAAAVLGDEYYVSGSGDDGTGDGTQGNPWRTISHAMDQASGDALTVHVGAGTYDEAAGEAFPIFIDEASLVSVAVVGPGDGSATVNTAPMGKFGGGSSGAPFLLASDRITGEVALSGLTIEGEASTVSMFAGISPAAVILFSGAGTVSVQDNEVSGLNLIVLQDEGAEDASILLENNIVVDFPAMAIDIDCDNSSSYSSTVSIDRDVTIRGNTFVSSDDEYIGHVDLYVNQGSGQQTLVFENNTMEGCRAFAFSAAAGSGAEISIDITISGNEGEDCDDGLRAYAYAYYGGAVDGTIDIRNNSLSMKDGSGINCYTGITSVGYMDVDVTIDSNDLMGGDRGIRCGGYASSSFYSSYTSVSGTGEAVRDFVITNNQISDMLYSGLRVSFSHWASGLQAENTVLIDGNTITSNGRNGLELDIEGYLSANSTADIFITRNDISFNGSDYSNCQVEMSFAVYTSCSNSISVDMRGNVLRNGPSSLVGTKGGYGDLLMELNAWVGYSSSYSSSANLTLSLDGGGTVQGYNTFSPRSSATTNSVSMEAFSGVNADLNLNGNWWGTTNPLEVEDLVFHGMDSSSLAIVDISTPLADELEFEASKSGSKIKLTANEGSGFVAYAGSTLIEVTVDGVVEDDVTVASDYLSLTFPKSGYSGSVTICVTNPGGQAGCTTFTVPSSGGGGCGVIPVSGGTPNAGQFFAQYFLLLLPMLFLLRRRMRGIRPQPVGYAA